MLFRFLFRVPPRPNLRTSAPTRIASAFSFHTLVPLLVACTFLLAPQSPLRAADTKARPVDAPDTSGLSGKDTVDLPPFVVTETKSQKAWRFAEADGFEIISQCDDDTTQEVFAALWRGPRLTLSPEFRPANSTPMAVILFNQPPEKIGGMESMGSVQAKHEVSSHWTSVIKRTIHDREIFSINLYGANFRYSSTFRFDLRTLLALRVPPAPPWLIEGLHGNFGIYREGIRYEEGDKYSEIVRALWDSPAEFNQADVLHSTAQVRADTAPAKRKPAPSPLLNSIPPLPVLWNGGLAADNATPAQRARWAATCALFARWGLYADQGQHHDAFWRFAAKACTQPITEEFFRECFGLGYEEARLELAWYLPVALYDPATHPLTGPLKAPKLKLRPATSAEIGRLRGEFARSEALLLSTRYPEIAAQYRQQATRALTAGYAADPTDTRLAATFGLHEYETGNTDHARQLLEAATVTGQARPRAWFALAQLRFTEAVAALANPKASLDATQATSVFIPLNEALRVTPAMAQSYELLAELWRRARDLPTAEILARLEEGQRSFPRNTRLTFATVRACVERNERQTAIAIIERSLPFILDPATRDRLEKTRTALADSLKPNASLAK